MVLAIFYKVIFETSTKRKFFSRSTASATQIIEHGESILLILFDITFATTDLLLGGSFFIFRILSSVFIAVLIDLLL